MLEKIERSSGPVVGYKAVGKITADDYKQLESEVQALLDQNDDKICLLIDLGEFSGEEISAWLPDLRFGRHFHEKIAKMAIVGDKRWQKWIAKLADPLYATDAKYFPSADTDDAWNWLRE